MFNEIVSRASAWLSSRDAIQELGISAKSMTEIELLNEANNYARNGYPQIAQSIGFGASSWSGIAVNELSAMNCSVVYAAVSSISRTMGSSPLNLMQYGPPKKVAWEHPLYTVLHDEPNPESTDMEFREAMTADVLLWGNAYALKSYRSGSGQVVALWRIKPNSVSVERAADDRRILYKVSGESGIQTTYEAKDIFHLRGLGFDGLRGYSVVRMAAQSIGLAQIQEKYVSQFFASGGRKPYYLKKATPFKDDTLRDNWLEAWRKRYGSSESFHDAPLMIGDMELHELGMPLDDAQLLGSREFSVPEICRWFGLTPHKVGDLSHATFSNVESLDLQHYKDVILPLAVRWEKSINRQLLLPAEKNLYFAKHNLDSTLRGDFATRQAGFATAKQNGWINADEIRDLDDRNPLPNGAGQAYTIQLNMATVPGTGEPTAAQAAVMANAANKKSAPPAQGS